MDVGQEFSSWENFLRALEQYSKEHKVVYIIGTCKPVESANRNESLQNKFPVKFKYCFARMLCKHYGNYTSQSAGQRPHQRTCKTGCTSSILVSVNKKRTALVVKETNMEHTHDMSDSIFSRYSQNRRLQGEERRMASVLLRAGVPLQRVQEFISNLCSKSPTIKDLQNIKTSMKGSLPEKEAHEFEFLTDLDQLMANDPDSIVEIINFDLVPGAIYIQTLKMTERMKSLSEGLVQIISHPINDGKISLVSVVGIDKDLNSHILSFCIIIVGAETSFQYFIEAFVRNNPTFCDTVLGVVLDFHKDIADFIQQLIPQANVAFSKSYILEKFAEEVKDSQKCSDNLQLRKELMNAASETAYEQALKELLEIMSVFDSKEFLRTWDSCKELWAQHEISYWPGLRHQKSAVETAFINSIKMFVKAPMGLSNIIKALMKFDRSEEPEESIKVSAFYLDPSCELYRHLCFPEASQDIICQIAIALNSQYEIKEQTDMIFVKRKDTEDEYILDPSGSRCTCRYFIDTDLPCQHIFAWLRCSDKPLYNETLVPAKWQVFGKAITLDALAESLTQGHVPSSFQHDERIKELQTVLRDTLATCCSHSYEQMGKDLILLKQIIGIMKSCCAQSVKLSIEEMKTGTQAETDKIPTVASIPRRRGRPPKSKKQHTELHESAMKPLESTQKHQAPPVGMRHNLRTNIKHKFVTRELPLALDEASDNLRAEQRFNCESKMEYTRGKVVSTVISDDRTELLRTITLKNDSSLSSLDQLVSLSPDDHNSVSSRESKENKDSNKDGEKFARLSGARHLSEYKEKLQAGCNVDTPRRGRRHVAVTHIGIKRSYSESQDNSTADDDDGDDDDDIDDEDESSGEMTSDEESDLETVEAKRIRKQKELEHFLEGTSQKMLNDVMQTASMLEPLEERAQNAKDVTELNSNSPADVLIRACQNKVEAVNFIINHIKKTCFGYDKYAYQVAACLFLLAFQTNEPINDLLQTVSDWPNHLPELPPSRPFEEEVTLGAEQTLTVCGHKLKQSDLDTLRPGIELSSKVLHAYLEILAQKHSGKMLVIPFDVVLLWREGRYNENIFHKVYFKTFEYLILPIHCGGEFTEAERESGDLPSPSWMALVADVKNKTVGIMNPRTEDKYIIAANGYMLQWRRYMQIRSVHTREMLSSWTTTHIACSKLESSFNSGICLLMSVEALINNVPPVIMNKAHIPNYLHYIAIALRDMDRETTVLCVGGLECQQLAARDADWLQCENCCTWWHRACAGHGDRSLIFYCSSCQQRIASVKDKVLKSDPVMNLAEDEVEEEEEEEDEVKESSKEAEKENQIMIGQVMMDEGGNS